MLSFLIFFILNIVAQKIDFVLSPPKWFVLPSNTYSISNTNSNKFFPQSEIERPSVFILQRPFIYVREFHFAQILQEIDNKYLQQQYLNCQALVLWLKW